MTASSQLRSPCASCPYRRDARLAFWSLLEYRSLQKHDHQLGQPFACHGERKLAPATRRFCAGWLLDQKRRGTPNLALRIELFQNPKLATHYERLRDLGKRLYSSISEMIEANYPGGRRRPMQPRKTPRKTRGA